MTTANEHEHETIEPRLHAYFDGELAADEERAVLDHLADCERCQTTLDDLMGLHVALGRPAASQALQSSSSAPPSDGDASRSGTTRNPPVSSIATRRSRRGLIMAGTALAAAAAVAVVVWAPWRGRHDDAQLALAETRPVEVRFTAPAFDAHRTYRVDRGGDPVAPSVPLATLSALERRGDRAALIAALAWSGDRARASAVADGLPETAKSLADRAGLLVLLGRAEDALEAADRAIADDEGLAVARWNRALALRELHLPMAAAEELDRIVALGEAGWAAEAATRASALRDDLARRRAAAADAARRRRKALAGGPPLGVSDVAIAPTVARMYFFDALRVASAPAELDALVPLAQALDAGSGGTEATRALSRARTLDLGARAPFVERYRAVAAGTASRADVDALLAALAGKGPALDELRLGVIMLGGRLRERLADVETIVGRSDDPFLQLLLVQERLVARRPAAGDRALAERLCDNPAWALRCGTIADVAAADAMRLGQAVAAERLAARAVDLLTSGGTGKEDERALVHLAEILRYRGRLALASATLAEARARTSSTDCEYLRSIENGEAEIERRRGLLGRAREHLLTPDGCPTDRSPLGLYASVDLARDSGAPADRQLAGRWIAAGEAAGLPPDYLRVARARLTVAEEAGARDLLLGVAMHPPEGEFGPAIADWAWRTIISDDGRRGDWNGAFLHTSSALGQERPTTCAISLAADDAIMTAAWRDANGTTGGAQWRKPAGWPALPASALAGCATTSLVAMSPLHGRPPPWKLGAWGWSTGQAALPATAATRDALVIAAPSPPSELLDLPALAPVPVPAGARGLTGGEATPSRVAAAMTSATYVEIHAHGLVDLEVDDGGFIALSPDAGGAWRLTASDVRKLKLAGAPVVVLAACRAAEAVTDHLRRWSLPDAFLAAGARAVIAADVAVPDDLIRAFVDDVRGRLERGEEPAAAAAAARAAMVARDPTSASWVDRLMVFE
jgi:hypothetical protein